MHRVALLRKALGVPGLASERPITCHLPVSGGLSATNCQCNFSCFFHLFASFVGIL